MYLNNNCLALALLACCCGSNSCGPDLLHSWNQWCGCHHGCPHGFNDFCFDYCCRHLPGFPGGPGCGKGHPPHDRGFPGRHGSKGDFGAFRHPGGFSDFGPDKESKSACCCKCCGCGIPGGSGFKGFGGIFC